MKEKIFMLDIETTGLNPTLDDVLEIAILECVAEEGFYKPSRYMDLFLPNPRKPETPFAKLNMQWLYDYCNLLEESADMPLSEDIRKTILAFFKRCGAMERWDRTIAGWNLGSLDIPFLFEKGMLEEGDAHYRLYDVGSCSELFHDAVVPDGSAGQLGLALSGIDGLGPQIELPTADMLPCVRANREDLAHWGLYDCYNQISKLNDLIAAFRKGVG